MRRSTLCATVVALLLSPGLAMAQEAGDMPPPPAPPADAFLDAMAGTWQGTGTIMGMQVTETMQSGWELGHQFFVAQTSSQVTMPDGQAMPLQAQMIHKPNGDGTYSGWYFDSMGMAGPFTAQIEEGNMVTDWHDPGHGANHRSVQMTNEDGSVTVNFLMQQEDDSWAESGQMVYTRAP